jgi:hypothetical protein
MKATHLLVEQHRAVDELFEMIESAEASEKASLRDMLAASLVAHSAIEKEIFYPAMKRAGGPKDLLAEAFEEHAVIEFALKKLTMVKPADDTFDAKVTVLKEMVQEHVGEEERELLRYADSMLGDRELDELGERMEARFEQIRTQPQAFKKLLDQSLGLGARAAMPKKAPRRAAAAPASKSRRAAPRPKKTTPKRRGATKQTARKITRRRTGRSRAA